MKKSVIVGLLITIIGTVMMAVALGHTGFKTIVWDDGFKVVDDQTGSVKMTKKTLKSSVNQIKFATRSRVVIQTGDVKKPTVSSSKFNEVKQSGRSINIIGKGHPRTQIVGFSMSGYSGGTGDVVITVPKDQQLEKVVGHDKNGVSISDITVNKLKLSGDGDIQIQNVHSQEPITLKNTDDTTLKNVTAPGINQTSDGGDLTYQNADFSNGATSISSDGGDVSLDSTKLKDVVINSDGGDIHLNRNSVVGSVIADADGGDINALISNRKEVQISASADDGDVSIFGSLRNSWRLSQHKNITYRLSSDGGDISVK